MKIKPPQLFTESMINDIHTNFNESESFNWHKYIAEQAQQILEQWLAEQRVVHCSDELIERDASQWHEKFYSHTKHVAYLTCITPLEQKCEAHAPDYILTVHTDSKHDGYWECSKCKKKLEPVTWSEA